jgi:hypothetical protein
MPTRANEGRRSILDRWLERGIYPQQEGLEWLASQTNYRGVNTEHLNSFLRRIGSENA